MDDALAGVESARTAGMTAAAIGPAALAGAGDWNLECLSRLLDLCPPLEGDGTCDPAHRLRHRWDPAPGTQREISPAVFREVVRLGKQGSASARPAGGSTTACGGLFAPIASRLYYVCENGAVVFGPGDPGPILAKETMERNRPWSCAGRSWIWMGARC